MRIIENRYLTYRARRIADRSWRERLLSWPWRPCASRKVVVVDAPMLHTYYVMNHSDVVCHPIAAQQLREAI